MYFIFDFRFFFVQVLTTVYILLMLMNLLSGCIARSTGITYCPQVPFVLILAARGLSSSLSVWLWAYGRYNNTREAICATLYIKS